MRCWCVFVLSSANSDSIKNGKICNERLKRHQLLLLDFVCSVTQFEKEKNKTKMWRLHWLSSSILAFPFHTGSLLLGRGFHLRRHHHGSTARTVRAAAFKKEKRFPPAAATTTRRYQFKKSAWTFLEIIINTKCDVEPSRAEPSRAAWFSWWFSSNTKAQPKPRPGPTPALHLQPPWALDAKKKSNAKLCRSVQNG